MYNGAKILLVVSCLTIVTIKLIIHPNYWRLIKSMCDFISPGGVTVLLSVLCCFLIVLEQAKPYFYYPGYAEEVLSRNSFRRKADRRLPTAH